MMKLDLKSGRLDKYASLAVKAGIASIYIYLHMQMGETFIAWVERFGGGDLGPIPTIYMAMSLLTAIISILTWLRFQADWIPTLSITLLFMVGTLPLYQIIYRSLVNLRDPQPLYQLINPGFTLIGYVVAATALYFILQGVPSLFKRGVRLEFGGWDKLAIDVLATLLIVFGGTVLLVIGGLRFHAASVALAEEAPELVRGLVTRLATSNLGYLIIIMAYLSIVTYILYTLIEPLAIYISGNRTQALSLLYFDKRMEARREAKVLKPRLAFAFIHGIPYFAMLGLVTLIHIIYLNTIIQYYQDPITYIANVMQTYVSDVTSYSNVRQPLILDTAINTSINLAELERAIELLRALLRFITRLVFSHG